MTGLQIALNTTFTGSTAPILPAIDPVAPTTGGLLLIDGTHPLGGFPAGAPTDNAVITNLLRDQAATLLSVSASTLDVTQSVVNMTSTYGKVERSTKGGIHAIQSTTQTTASQGYQAKLPANLVGYIKTNGLTNSFYFSVWNMPTRLRTGVTSDAFAVMQDWASNGVPNNGVALVWGAGSSMTGTTLIGNVNVGRGTVNTAVASAFGATAFSAEFRNSPNTNPSRNAIFETGNFSRFNNASGGSLGQHGARVYYRAYIEDLTVSGRTFEQVYALDLAEFNRQFSAGGRYYGDTVPTDPTTFT